jgi:hypothetical protein
MIDFGYGIGLLDVLFFLSWVGLPALVYWMLEYWTQ